MRTPPIVAAAIGVALAGCASAPHPTLRVQAKGLPSVIPLPTAPRHVAFAALHPRVNQDTPCAHLATPGYYWETLAKPDCWNEDFGNIRHYAEDYDFIVGWRLDAQAAYLIYNLPNGAMQQERLPGGVRLHFAAVHATDLCLAPVGSSRVIASFDWETRYFSSTPAEGCT